MESPQSLGEHQPGINPAFPMELVYEEGDSATRLAATTYLPEVKGKDVNRYYMVHTGKYLSYGPWLAEPRTPDFFMKPKVVLRKVLGFQRLHGTFIEEPAAIDQSLYTLISINRDRDYLLFVLGVMLSRIGAWYLRTKYAIYDTLYPWYTQKQLGTFPLKSSDIRIVKLVKDMLELHKKKPHARTPQEITRLEREIATADKEIDQLVYELYGLTKEEIKIVEVGTT